MFSLRKQKKYLWIVIVIDLFNETVLFNHRGGRSPPRLLNRKSS